MPARFVADTHVFYRIDHLVGAARGKDPRVQNDCINYPLVN